MFSAQVLSQNRERLERDMIVVDIDGTLALIEHRLHHIQQEEPDWETFFNCCGGDAPNDPIIKLVNSMHVAGYVITLATTRPERIRNQTAVWLLNNNICFDRLIMRRDDDVGEDDAVKKGWLDNDVINEDRVLFVIDDRQRVVDMWREQGFTCLQPREGDF